MRCTKCGFENPDGSSFCFRCGQTLFQSAAQVSAPITKASVSVKRKSDTVKIVLAVIVGAALIFAGIYYYIRNKYDMTIVFEAVADDPTEEEMSWISGAYETFLVSGDFNIAYRTRTKGKRIIVDIGKNADKSYVSEVADKMTERLLSLNNSVPDGMVVFKDSDDHIVLDHNDIESAVRRDDSSAGASDQNYVEVRLTSEGAAKLAQATEKAAKKKPPYNYISIVVNNNVISQPTVREKIDSDTLKIMDNFTEDEATDIANSFSLGALPFEMKRVK